MKLSKWQRHLVFGPFGLPYIKDMIKYGKNSSLIFLVLALLALTQRTIMNLSKDREEFTLL